MTSPTLRPLEADATVEQLPRRSTLDSVIFCGVFGLLLFNPLAFGAVEPWSIFILEWSASLLFVLWALRQAKSGELLVVWNPLFPPILIFAALVALQLATGRTAYRYETLSSALLYCAYGLLCFLAVQYLRRTSQVKTLAIVVPVYGFAVAMFALIQSMSSNNKPYWLRMPRSGGWIYGPYVNHNHYAGLMEMLAPIPLVFALTRNARGPRRLWPPSPQLQCPVRFFFPVPGGMAAFAVQMAILAGILISQRKGRRVALLFGVFLVIGVALLAWLGGGELARRMASIHTEARGELSGGLRMTVNRDALKMFAHKPWLGWGLGVFPDIYPQFRTFHTNFFVNEAHDDYLQLLVEMGGLGFATMLWFVIVMYRGALKKLGNWPEDIKARSHWRRCWAQLVFWFTVSSTSICRFQPMQHSSM
jgi:O-antigen ligase